MHQRWRGWLLHHQITSTTLATMLQYDCIPINCARVMHFPNAFHFKQDLSHSQGTMWSKKPGVLADFFKKSCTCVFVTVRNTRDACAVLHSVYFIQLSKYHADNCVTHWLEQCQPACFQTWEDHAVTISLPNKKVLSFSKFVTKNS